MDEAEHGIYSEQKLDEYFVQDWLAKFKNDSVIQAYFERLKKIGESVFDEKNQRIEHIKCNNMPIGMNEDSYIDVYKKQQACIRHEIYKIMQRTGGQSMDPQM